MRIFNNFVYSFHYFFSIKIAHLERHIENNTTTTLYFAFQKALICTREKFNQLYEIFKHIFIIFSNQIFIIFSNLIFTKLLSSFIFINFAIQRTKTTNLTKTVD